jgi:hypothetical protein
MKIPVRSFLAIFLVALSIQAGFAFAQSGISSVNYGRKLNTFHG